MIEQEFERRLDELTTSVMVPLRTEKIVVEADVDALCHLVDDRRRSGFFDTTIEVRLAGKLWSLFCYMLAEADHARDPDPILDAAWRYANVLEQAFDADA